MHTKTKYITLQSKITVRVEKDNAGRHSEDRQRISLHWDDFIFNEILPQDLGFVDRSIPDNELKLEVDFHGRKEAAEADPGESYQYTWSDQDSRGTG